MPIVASLRSGSQAGFCWVDGGETTAESHRCGYTWIGLRLMMIRKWLAMGVGIALGIRHLFRCMIDINEQRNKQTIYILTIYREKPFSYRCRYI